MARLISDTEQRARPGTERRACSGYVRRRRAPALIAGLAGCVALALVAGCSHSDSPLGSGSATRPTATKSPAPCELGLRSEIFVVLDTMPRPIVNALMSRLTAQTDEGFKPIVDRDQYFHATDKITGPRASYRRFIQGGRFGNSWIVLYEQGGASYRVHAVVYELPNREAAPLLKAHVDTTIKSMCDTVKQLVSRPDDPHPILEDW